MEKKASVPAGVDKVPPGWPGTDGGIGRWQHRVRARALVRAMMGSREDPPDTHEDGELQLRFGCSANLDLGPCPKASAPRDRAGSQPAGPAAFR